MTFEDALTFAHGLCESECRKWEKADPKTGEHWRQVSEALQEKRFNIALDVSRANAKERAAIARAEDMAGSDVRGIVLD